MSFDTFDFLFLKIHRNREMSHSSIGESSSARQVHHIFDVRWTHDPFVVNGNVHEKFVQGDILLGMSSDQIVKLQAGNSQHRLVVELGIV